MDRYTFRMNLRGATPRERYVNQFKEEISRKSLSNPSYKNIRLNGTETQLIINSGTEPFYKEFQSLPGQQILTGDYVEWSNQVWLVYTADSDDEMYTDGKLRQCQHKIFWQKDDGTIISRYVWTQNASAYNNGEQGNSTITLQSNQFMVYIPYDEATECLNNGKRVHMSKSNIVCKPYELTRPDDISYGYGEKGVLNIIFTQSQFNEQNDKLVTLEDGSKVWICDYHSPAPSPEPPAPDETTDLCVTISGGNTLRYGRAKTWTVAFKNTDGNEVTNCDFTWNIISGFDITKVVEGNKIQLKVDDEDCVDSSILLQIIMTNNNSVIAELEITIIEGL